MVPKKQTLSWILISSSASKFDLTYIFFLTYNVTIMTQERLGNEYPPNTTHRTEPTHFSERLKDGLDISKHLTTLWLVWSGINVALLLDVTFLHRATGVEFSPEATAYEVLIGGIAGLGLTKGACRLLSGRLGFKNLG